MEYRDKNGMSKAKWHVFPVEERYHIHIAGRPIENGGYLVVCEDDQGSSFHNYTAKQMDRFRRNFERV